MRFVILVRGLLNSSVISPVPGSGQSRPRLIRYYDIYVVGKSLKSVGPLFNTRSLSLHWGFVRYDNSFD